MKCNPGLILHLLKYSVNHVKALIISLSLLLFIDVVMMALQSHTYMMYMYVFTLLDVVGKRSHRYGLKKPSFVVLSTTLVKKTTFILLFYYRHVSGGFYLVG